MATTIIESQIDTVRIYSQGATIERTLELSADEGLPSEIEIPKLPLSLIDATARVRVVSVQGGGRLVASNLRVGLYVPPRGPPPEDPTDEQIRAVERDLELRHHAIDHLELEMALLNGVEVPSRPEPEEGKPPPASPMVARLSLEDFVEQGLRERSKMLRQYTVELEAQRKVLAELMERRRLASNANTASVNELTKSVVVGLTGSGSVKNATLRLEYFVPGARWAPSYQFRLTQGGDQAEIQLRALVSQASGEDWSSARLVLSTAAPLSWTELPELSSVRIGRAQPPVGPRGFRPPPVGAASLFGDYDRGRQACAGLVDAPSSVVPRLGHVRPLSLELDRRSMPAKSMREEAYGAAVGGSLSVESMPMASRAMADESSIEEEYDDMVEGTDAEMVMPMEAPAFAKEAPPPAPSARPAPRRAKKSAARSRATGARSAPGQAVLESLVYTQLVLPKPDNDGRSKLRPLDTEELYRQSLEARGIELSGDWSDAVHAAERRAMNNGSRGLPSGAFDLRNGGSNFFDFTYEADTRVDVPSDGGFHNVTLGSREAPSDVQYVTVPREDPQVFRVAKVKNPSAAPLLPGPAEVYVGGEYVLSTRFPLVVPFGEFQLGLGVEQAIKCARNTRYEEARSGDQVVATNELRHGIDIELVNNLPRAVHCEVRERIPQPSEQAEVVVEELAVEPGWSRYLQEERSALIRGGRRWIVVVPPNDKASLKADYVVKIYANNELVGGNRREV